MLPFYFLLLSLLVHSFTIPGVFSFLLFFFQFHAFVPHFGHTFKSVFSMQFNSVPISIYVNVHQSHAQATMPNVRVHSEEEQGGD